MSLRKFNLRGQPCPLYRGRKMPNINSSAEYNFSLYVCTGENTSQRQHRTSLSWGFL